ncbi:MAG: N-acetylmuramoyl-L-alanine amidase [Pseudomonadota bacterium]
MKKKIIAHTISILLLVFVLESHVLADSSERKYQEARTAFKTLEVSKAERKYRYNWISCARKFEEVYKRYPKGKRADNAMYMVGKIYQQLYGYSNKESDLDKAMQFYGRVVKRYPESNVADDAQFRIAEIYEKYKGDKSKAYTEYSKVVANFPKGSVARRAKLRLDNLERFKPTVVSARSSKPRRSDLGVVKGIRHWSNPDYTRVVIEVGETISYRHRLLRRDPSIKKPPRLYIDLFNARISPDVDQPIPIDDGLLKMARAGQHTKDCVRVVLDIQSIKDYKVFPLEDPFRIVIDVTGEGTLSTGTPPKQEGTKPPSLSAQLGLGVGKIVIDPGHGGHDPGAIGPSGLKEKDVVLEIAKNLETIIKKEIGCEVVLTRRDDRFIPLEERTAIANTQKADLFVSIHANASPNRDAQGIETYFLNFSADEEAMRVAARENATSTKKMSDLRAILRDLMLNSKINESSRLARYIQESLVAKLNTEYSDVRDLGVKQAPFYVLIGAEMPSILVEVSFISSRTEEKRLRNKKYLGGVATSIFDGVKGYIDGMKVAAH